jgi:hypothetical protein
MSEIFWAPDASFDVAGVDQTLGSILSSIETRRPDWVVLEGPGDNYYAYRPGELGAYAEHFPDLTDVPAARALRLEESQRSLTVRIGQQPAVIVVPRAPVSQPARLRAVLLDANDRPQAIGETERLTVDETISLMILGQTSEIPDRATADEPAGEADRDNSDPLAYKEPAQQAQDSAGQATDAARREARERGVDLTKIEGTGSDGRILVSDVVETAEAMEAEEDAAASEAAGQVAEQAQQVAEQAQQVAGQAQQAQDYYEEAPGSGAGAGVQDAPEDSDLGPLRGGGHAEEATSSVPERSDTARDDTSEVIDAILSAEAPREIGLGEEAVVDVRLELEDGAAPLEHSVSTRIGTEEEIVAILSVRGTALEVSGPRILRMPPPGPGSPRDSFFLVKGKESGAAELAVMFRQGSSDLGTVSFATTVVQEGAQQDTVRAQTTAAQRDLRDDELLVLLIDEFREGNLVRYQYHVNWAPLQMNYEKFKSEVFTDAGGDTSTPLRYVQSIYTRILDQLVLNQQDLRMFQRELKALGTEMSRQLFDPEFVRRLWDRRGAITAVQVTSWEPYIPWELLRLKHPDTDETDDKFFSEYGLVRSVSGRSGPPKLRKGDWKYLKASYPNNSYPAIGGEVSYLTNKLPQRGINPLPIPADKEEFLNTLTAADFDVLHIACHGETKIADIELTNLIISDRQTPQGTAPVTVSPALVREEANLKDRTPLVFLNACETGQQAPSLTDWGGWPATFWATGAGAFVGTSWSVREKPSIAFAEAFYDALLEGSNLAEAANAGRDAAKRLGDGSWLAYVVYGNPTARIGL